MLYYLLFHFVLLSQTESGEAHVPRSSSSFFGCLLFVRAGPQSAELTASYDWTGHRSRGPFLGPEKTFVKLRPAYSVKLVFAYLVKGIEMKITASFPASRRFRFEDTERIMSHEMRPNVSADPASQSRLRAQSLIRISIFIHTEIRNNYHDKNFALKLALKERLSGTRKWSILINSWPPYSWFSNHMTSPR